MGGSGGNTFPLRGAPCRVSDIGRPGKRGQIDHARPSLSDGEIGTEKPTPSPDAEKKPPILRAGGRAWLPQDETLYLRQAHNSLEWLGLSNIL